jgi:hypothetical protein
MELPVFVHFPMRGMQGGGGCFGYIKVLPPYNSRSHGWGGRGQSVQTKGMSPCPPDMLRTAVGTEPDTLAHTGDALLIFLM